jgi:flagellar biosynthesis protein FlhB
LCIGRNNCKRSSSTLKHHHSTFNIRLFQQRLVRAMVFILVLLLMWLQQLVMVQVLQQELILLLVFIQLQLLRLGDFQQVRQTFFLYKIINEL